MPDEPIDVKPEEEIVSPSIPAVEPAVPSEPMPGDQIPSEE